jgi:hypothetical protein
MEPAVSIPCSQEPATGPYPIAFNIYYLFMFQNIQWNYWRRLVYNTDIHYQYCWLITLLILLNSQQLFYFRPIYKTLWQLQLICNTSLEQQLLNHRWSGCGLKKYVQGSHICYLEEWHVNSLAKLSVFYDVCFILHLQLNLIMYLEGRR